MRDRGTSDSTAAVSIMRAEGADVIQKGESWVEANEHALQLVCHCFLFSDASLSHDLSHSSHTANLQRRVHTSVRSRAAVERPLVYHR